MAAVNLSSSSTPVAGAQTFYPGWSKEETIESRVQQLMVSKFTEIVADYDLRKTRHNKDDLGRGPWYANHYAPILRKQNLKARLDALIQRHAFYHGFAPKGFTQPADQQSITGKAIAHFQIQPNCLPTTALDNVRNGQVSLIDCGAAVELAMYETLREVLGDERFNAIFKEKLCLHYDMAKTPLASMKFFKSVSTKSPKPGDMVYFANPPLYVTRHPNGESKGYNAVCISPENDREKKYIAFGTSAEGKTDGEMHDLLIHEFNEQPINPTLLFEKKLADHFISEAQNMKEQCLQQRFDIDSIRLTRDDSKLFIQQSDRTLASFKLTDLKPDSAGIRLNTAEIKKYLK